MDKNTKPWAMILAAGLGTRLRPLTNKTPKPAIKLWNKPIIYYLLENLENAGYKNVVVNTHHLPTIMEKCLTEYQGKINIDISFEKVLLGTAGAVRFAANNFNNLQDGCLLIHGDIFIDYDISKFSTNKDYISLLGLLNKKYESYEGNLSIDKEGRVIELGKYFKRDNFESAIFKKSFFTGIQYLPRKYVKELMQTNFNGLVDQFYPYLLAKNIPIYATIVECKYDDLGEIYRLNELNTQKLS